MMRAAVFVLENGLAMKLRRTLVVVGLLTALPACAIIGTHSHTDVTGTRISEATLNEIKVGDAQDYVQALLGSPTSTTELGDHGELWKYSYRKTETSEGGILLLVSSSKTTETEGTVFVRFEDGKVTRYWRG